ncbi:MAG TPA: DUF4148 domain-containing protein [Hydrogenophaga sp.]|uniref:DUF4148 domain-containing protein n=1 Tax=Hydrogenophaga sp. TaxID=1904254 RepID=UPI002C352570|nr:DUF4148 domain-containing protein [Hydrogenophaga sp.]HSX92500.1 DUF4148 domain-containing protein [Hydrogenophaga sp.]
MTDKPRQLALIFKEIIMKAALLPIAFALTAGAAFAEGPIFVDPPFTSTLSRAEVRAQAVDARDAGLFALGDGVVVVADNAASNGLSRTQVRAEAAEALRLGLHNGGEITVVPTAAQTEQIRTAGLRAVSGDKLVQSGNAVTAN